MKIARDVLEEMGRHAVGEYPRECCGILIGRGEEVVEARESKNVAEAGRLKDRYTVDPLAIVRADREADARGLEIVGFYHSHPDHPARPSGTDVGQAWGAYRYVIVSVRGGRVEEVRAWTLVRDGEMVEESLEVSE